MRQFPRRTHQRETILQELSRSKDHPTAEELYKRIRKQLPRISLATVYRNLETLAETGIIKKLEVSGRHNRFDWDTSDHDHIYCVRCHRIDNFVAVPHIHPFNVPVQLKGYQVTGCRVEFYGICPKCFQKHPPYEKGEQSMAKATVKTAPLNEKQRLVLEALSKTPEPCGSKELAAATGLETKQVSCQITALKNKGYVNSPVRCKYTITEQGESALS
ncbi:MAG: Fur family transcriptional regulator [Desulfobulbus sp.]|nr:Fur family transcriptional regulator [Desulfobulbus sp.]